MGAWVKTQDGNKIVNLKIFELAKKAIKGRVDPQDFGFTLGKYDSPERAEIIFNELCEFIENKDTNIFIMPIK
ncbi:hypothetical protein PV797_04770 [Clostridiaceae bacterium M8S5]|nr:hypothetical protein PV797_04770 [Clostridiaceae bacterium M8S5]